MILMKRRDFRMKLILLWVWIYRIFNRRGDLLIANTSALMVGEGEILSSAPDFCATSIHLVLDGKGVVNFLSLFYFEQYGFDFEIEKKNILKTILIIVLWNKIKILEHLQLNEQKKGLLSARRGQSWLIYVTHVRAFWYRPIRPSSRFQRRTFTHNRKAIGL